MHPLLIAAVRGGNPGIVTLSGESFSKDGSQPSAGIRVNTDGTIDKYTDVDGGTPVYTQIDAATDFIIPNSAVVRRTFHVKAEQDAQSGSGTLTGTLSSWLEVSTARQWDIERASGQGAGSSIWDITLHISDDGGSTTLDTGAYEMDAIIL